MRLAIAMLVASCGVPELPERDPPTPPLPAHRNARGAVDEPDDDANILGDPRLRWDDYANGFAISDDRTLIAVTHEHSIDAWHLPDGKRAFTVHTGGVMPQFAGDALGAMPYHGGPALHWWNAHGEASDPAVICPGRVAVRGERHVCADGNMLRTGTHKIRLDDLARIETAGDALAISPDGKWLAASTGVRVQGFDLATGKLAWTRELEPSRDCFAFDRGGRLVMATHEPYDRTTGLVVLDPTTGRDLEHRSLTGEYRTCDVADQMLVVGKDDVQILALSDLATLATLPPAPFQIRFAAFGADGTIWAGTDHHILHWRHEQWDDPTGNVRALALSPDGTTVATVDTAGRLVLWDIATHGLRVIRDGQDFALAAVAYSADGHHIAVGSFAQTYSGITGPADGRSVVEVWDIATARRTFTIRRDRDIAALAFSSGRLYVLDDHGDLIGVNPAGRIRSRRRIVEKWSELQDYAVERAQLTPTAVIAELHAVTETEVVAQTLDGKPIPTRAGSPDLAAAPWAADFLAGKDVQCRATLPDGRTIACRRDGLVEIRSDR